MYIYFSLIKDYKLKVFYLQIIWHLVSLQLQNALRQVSHIYDTLMTSDVFGSYYATKMNASI